MIKIKNISNDQLKEYLEAYKELLELDTNNEEIDFKVKAIEKAINNRELLGIKVKKSQNETTLTKFLSKLKKSKK